MRLMTLYLRSRMAGRALAVVASVAVATWLWTRWSGGDAITITLLPLAMPLAAAAIIGTGSGSPFGEGEAAAGGPLGPLRLGHLAGLFCVASLALTLAVLRWGLVDGGWLLVRNLAGFTGLALLTPRVMGSGLSWAVPLAYAVLALVIAQSGQTPLWAWSARAARDQQGALIAAALLLTGLALVARLGARDCPGETL